MQKPKSFTTARLTLKPADESDAAFVFELLNTPKWIAFIGQRNVHSIADARLYIRERMSPQLNRLGYGNYVVILESEQKTIGSCGLYQRPGLQLIDIGFAFLPGYEKQGYGYEAATCLMHAAKHDFNLQKLCAITTKDNIASQNLLIKLGFTFKNFTTLPGDGEVELMYYLAEL